MAFGMGSSFNEPQTNDPTSAPAMPMMPTVNPTPKKKPPKQKNPAPLAAAIARAKRAHQGSHKYGS